MSRIDEIVSYQQSTITKIMTVLSQLIKTKDTLFFDNFAKNYGIKKICKIVNLKGIDFANIKSDRTTPAIDKISLNIINKTSKQNHINCVLPSKYFYTKYTQNELTGQMDAKHIQIAFNTLTKNSKVNIKKLWSIDELVGAILARDVVFLGIKEKQVSETQIVAQNLTETDLQTLVSYQNNFLTSHIMPSVRYAGRFDIAQNAESFERAYPGFKKMMAKMDIKIAKQVLQYEVENQQISLEEILETEQQKFLNFATKYTQNTQQIKDYLNRNQQLLNALSPNKNQLEYTDAKDEGFEMMK